MVRAAPQVSTGAPSLTVNTSTDSKTSLMSYTYGGTCRWMSPEMLIPEEFGMKECRPSKQSDCYSLAMTVYEVRGHSVMADASD